MRRRSRAGLLLWSFLLTIGAAWIVRRVSVPPRAIRIRAAHEHHDRAVVGELDLRDIDAVVLHEAR